MQTKLLAFAAALLAAAPAAAQQPAPTTLRLAVAPTLVALPGRVLRVTYRVTNLATSTDSLWSFTVDAPAAPLRITAPTPDRWTVVTRDHDLPVARWGILEGMIRPGGRTPPLVYEAAGVPDIVRYRAVRYFAVPDGDQGETDPTVVAAAAAAAPADPFAGETVTGYTIGVAPPPANLAEALLRLRRLIDQACALGWIDNRGVCTSFHANAAGTVLRLVILLRDLDAQHGRHVDENAYALLAPNVQHILQMH